MAFILFVGIGILVAVVGNAYIMTDGFKISIQDGISKSIRDTENWQEQNRQCIDDCVHNGGIFETCKSRCFR